MPETPLISILIPCYNAERYVAEAIESALTQTYRRTEVVVVDDGSTDKTLEVLKAFGSRIRWEAAPHQGACATRNRALELSQGEYIQFLDADDVLFPRKVETLAAFLISGKADMAWSPANLFYTGKPQFAEKPIAFPDGCDPVVFFLRNNPGTNAPLHRRRMLEAVGGFRPGLPKAQEYDLHVRLGALNPKLLTFPEPLYAVRLHDGPKISSTRTPEGYMLQLRMRIAREFEKAGVLADTNRRIALAALITQDSIYAFRNGRRDLARTGFQFASSLHSGFAYSERPWVRNFARFLGPLGAEYILLAGRKVRRTLTRRPLQNTADRKRKQ